MPADMRFGEAVTALLAERGYTLRSQRIRTGLAHSTVKSWIDGVRPSWDGVVQFAEGLGLDVNEWLSLAGYTPITQQSQGDEELLAALDEFEQAAAAAGWAGAVIAHQGGTAKRSARDRAADLRAWSAKLREMAAEP